MAPSKSIDTTELTQLLGRITDALERLSPPRLDSMDLDDADAFI